MTKKNGGSPRRGLLGKPITTKQIDAIARRNQATFRGLLNEPLDPVSELHLKKLIGLLLHYGIDRKSPDCWFQLSYALALKHEVGFTVKKKTGPPGNRYGEKFVRAVQETRDRNGLNSDTAAIKALQAEGRYHGHLPTVQSALRTARASLKAKEEREKAERGARETFIREAMLALDGPPSEKVSRQKRRS